MYIHAYSRLFSHIQTYSGIIRYIQELFRDIHAYSEPCVTLTYLEPWYIRNPGIFKHWHIQNSGVFRTLVYSEHFQTSTMERFRKLLTANIIFAKSAFPVLDFVKKYMNFFNTGLPFTRKYLFTVKEHGA